METSTDARLFRLGWTEGRGNAFAPYAQAGFIAARAVTAARDTVRAASATGQLTVVVQRGFRRGASAASEYPVVGDWLALEPLDGENAALRAVLPRSSVFSRGDHEVGTEQVIAANVDTAVIVAALTYELNLRRLERYLALAWSSGAAPVVLLNKADLCPDLPARVAEVTAVAGGAPVLVASALTGQGLDGLRPYLAANHTVCLLGSSGVGKSTITNALLGEERQLVREVRADDQRGRHTTTGRELFELPVGGLLIDTPGMRAIGLWDADDGVERAFADIDAIALECRFSDCAHDAEPGCAVRAAIERGDLDGSRLESRRKLELEMRSIERRMSVAAARAEGRRMGKLYRDAGKQAARKQRPWEARP